MGVQSQGAKNLAARLRPVLLYTALGLGASVGVAWWLAFTPVEGPAAHQVVSGPDALILDSFVQFGSELIVAPGLRPNLPERPVREPRLWEWSVLARGPWPAVKDVERGFGWPLLCLRWRTVGERLTGGLPLGERSVRPPPQGTWTTVDPGMDAAEIAKLVVAAGSAPKSLPPAEPVSEPPRYDEYLELAYDGGRLRIGLPSLPETILPFEPIWPGLLANVALYGGAAFLGVRSAGLLRATYRRRRGVCPGCCYPTAGLTVSRCPECGRRLVLVDVGATLAALVLLGRRT